MRRLKLIRHARELGFDLDAISQSLALAGSPDASCVGADAIARDHLASVEDRIAQLTALRDELYAMVVLCEYGRIAEGRVVEVVADHAQCLAGTHRSVVARGPLGRVRLRTSGWSAAQG